MGIFTLDNKKVFVAGHNGMAGSAICRALQHYQGVQWVNRNRNQLDLMDNLAVTEFFASEKPQVVFFAAAKVGGIVANMTYPADFIYQNITIQNNVIHNACVHGVEKLVFLASSAIYPKNTPNPIPESALLSGHLEPSNDAYAVAKIAGIKMCQAYRKQYGFDAISIILCNLYGYGDTYRPKNSHVLPSLIHRFHEAKINNAPTVAIWGTGKVLREFLFSEDAGQGIVFACENYSDMAPVNLGYGADVTIAELAYTIKDVVGYKGKIVFDTTKPEGIQRKLIDSSTIKNLGWQPHYDLRSGIENVYADFVLLYQSEKGL